MSVGPAEFVRWVDADEPDGDLVDEAKDLTWTDEAEHALIALPSAERALIRGGRDGIEFRVIASADGRQALEMDGEAGPLVVARVEWHTHPVATGPSDGDREALRILGQRESRIFEIGGERHGTVFGPDKHRPGD